MFKFPGLEPLKCRTRDGDDRKSHEHVFHGHSFRCIRPSFMRRHFSGRALFSADRLRLAIPLRSSPTQRRMRLSVCRRVCACSFLDPWFRVPTDGKNFDNHLHNASRLCGRPAPSRYYKQSKQRRQLESRGFSSSVSPSTASVRYHTKRTVHSIVCHQPHSCGVCFLLSRCQFVTGG